MSIKHYKDGKWQIFPGTIGAPGKDAYTIAVENGYTGTREAYNSSLTKIPEIFQNVELLLDNISLINSYLEDLIVDDLESSDPNKALSAKQGAILNSLIQGIKTFNVVVVDGDLPDSGEPKTIYLKRKDESDNDIYEEYLWINNNWELIGTTRIDLTNYYTKEQVDDKLGEYVLADTVYNKETVDSKISNIKIPTPSFTESGVGNVVTGISNPEDVNSPAIVTKDLSVYSKNEIDDKFKSVSGGDVRAEAIFVKNKLIISADNEKTVKSSDIDVNDLVTTEQLNNYVTSDQIEDLAHKSDLNEYLKEEDAESVYQKKGDFALKSDLTGLATEKWVENKNYLTEIPDEYITEEELEQKNFIDSNTVKNYIPKALPNVEPLIINGERYTGEYQLSVDTSERLHWNFPSRGAVVAGEATYIDYEDTITEFINFSVRLPDAIIHSTAKIKFMDPAGKIKVQKDLDSLEGQSYVYCLSFIPTSWDDGFIYINGAVYE